MNKNLHLVTLLFALLLSNYCPANTISRICASFATPLSRNSFVNAPRFQFSARPYHHNSSSLCYSKAIAAARTHAYYQAVLASQKKEIAQQKERELTQQKVLQKQAEDQHRQNQHNYQQETARIAHTQRALQDRKIKQRAALKQSGRKHANPYYFVEQKQADQKLNHALQKMLVGDRAIRTNSYHLSPGAQALLQKCAINPHSFTQCIGNLATQEKHAEIVLLTDTFGEICDERAELQNLGCAVYDFLDGAAESNKNGDLIASCEITDFCWTALACVPATWAGLKTGAIKGVVQIIDTVSHPIMTAYALMDAGKQLGAFVGAILLELAQHNQILDRYNTGLFLGIDTGDPVAQFEACAKNSHALKQVGQAIDHAYREIKNRSWPERVKLATELGTEFVVSNVVYGKLLHGAGRLLSRGAVQAKKLHKIIHKTISKKLKKKKSFEKILATAEGLEIRIAGESMMFFEGEAEKAGMALAKGKVPSLEEREIARIAKEMKKQKISEYITQHTSACKKMGLEAPSNNFLNHVFEGHMPGGTKAIVGKKSLFHDGTDFVTLALKAWEEGTLIEPGIKLYNCGYPIGISIDGQVTSQVKVVLNKTLNGFTTVYPI